METQHHGTRVLCMETVSHDMRPHATCSTKLSNLFKQIVVAIKEERKLPREAIYIQSRVNRRLHIGDRMTTRKGHLWYGGRASRGGLAARVANGLPQWRCRRT